MPRKSPVDVSEERMIVAPASKLKTKSGPKFHESRSRIHGHNFAIRLLQTLESRMDLLRDDFSVGEGFRRQPSTLKKADFIECFLKHIDAGPKAVDETSWLASMPRDEIIAKLAEVFDAADGDAKGKLSFSGFMGYVIDCARYGEVGAVQEAIPDYAASEGTFFMQLDDITIAKYCPELCRVLTSGTTIGMVETATLHAKSMDPYAPFRDSTDTVCCVYDLDYVPHLESVATVGTDLAIDFLHAQTGLSTLRIPTKHTYSRCSFDRSTSLLLTTKGPTVHMYGLQPHRATAFKWREGTPLTFHTSSVNCIFPLQRGGLLATGSSDNTVVISDLEAGERITTFKAHTRSIHHIDYIAHLNLMMSCAYDTEPKVWMLASSAMRSEAFTLRDVENPHTGIVTSACTIPDTPQVCTLDSHGMVKLWDIRMFRSQQSVRLDKAMKGIFEAKMLKWHSLIWDGQAQELIAFAQRRAQKLKRKVLLKEDLPSTAAAAAPSGTAVAGLPRGIPVEQPQGPQSRSASMADDLPIVALCYEGVSQTLLTLSERKVRIWDLFTGHQEAMFDKLVPPETTASCICVAHFGQRFVLGCRNGRISVHQYSSGSLLGLFAPEGSPEVTSLVYYGATRTVGAVTWRGARIYLDDVHDPQPFFPDVSRGEETKMTSYDAVLNAMVTVERKGHVSIWESRVGPFDINSIKACGTVTVAPSEGTVALLLTGYPILAVATSAGGVQLFTVSPHAVPNRKIAEVFFKGRDILLMQFYPPKRILYCADDFGWIHAFDLTSALELVNAAQPQDTWSGIMKTSGRLGAPPRDITILRTVAHVHAHSEPITGLVWASGCNILVSCSADHRVLLWSLSLEFIGELDPLSETGRYVLPVIPVVLPKLGAPVTYATERAAHESIPFTNSNPTLHGVASHTLEAGGGAQSAAKLAEGVAAMTKVLDSFLPTTTAEKEAKGKKKDEQLLAQIDRLAMRPANSGYGSSVVPREMTSKLLQAQNVDEEEGDGAPLHPTALYSPNATGVHCHDFFSRSPTAGNSHRKKFVVEESPVEDVQKGAVRFVTTRDHPLPPNARRDRDWTIRQLQEREEEERRRALSSPAFLKRQQLALPQHPQHPPQQSRSLPPQVPLPSSMTPMQATPQELSLSYPTHQRPISGLLHTSNSPPLPTTAMPPNSSIISRLSSAEEGKRLSTAFPWLVQQGTPTLAALVPPETIRNAAVPQLTTKGASWGDSSSSHLLQLQYRSLLPKDLLAIKRSVSQQSRRLRTVAMSKGRRTPLSSSEGLHHPTMSHRLTTPTELKYSSMLSEEEDDGPQWSTVGGAREGRELSSMDREARHRSSPMTQTLPMGSRGNTTNPVLLKTVSDIACSSVPSVPPDVFAVRSVTPFLQKKWIRSHSVPLDMDWRHQ